MLKKMSNLHKITLVFLVFTLISLTFAADKNQKLNPKDPKHREEASKQEAAKEVKAGNAGKPKKDAKVAEPVKPKKVAAGAKEIEQKHNVNVGAEAKKKEEDRKRIEEESKRKAAQEKEEVSNETEEKNVATHDKAETNEIEESVKKPDVNEAGVEEAHGNEAVEKEVEKKEPDAKKVEKKQGQEDGKSFKLAKHPSCVDDAKQLCTDIPKDNNFAVLVCLQDAAAQDDDQVSDDCHELLWEYKKNLTMSVMFDKAAFEVCESFMNELQPCKKDFPPDGSLVNCLVEHRELAKNQKCRGFLHKMAAIVYSDYRLIKGFYKHCHNEVVKHNCGKLSTRNENDPHTQAEVIECLEDNIAEVSKECQAEIKKVAELSSDDYHMDRAVFYACQDARERFCSNVQSGDGRIYKCLMDHKMEDAMAEDCREALTVRQKLMQQDVKVNHPLWEHCEKHAKEYNCQQGETTNGQASHLILCLNKAIADGKEVNGKCQAEMQDFATQLFADYKLNPEVVAHCEKILDKECRDQMKAEGGALDCLMSLGDKLDTKCYEAVHEVLKDTNAGGDFKIDRPLYFKCQSFIESNCKGKPEALILSCLMDNMRSDSMTPDCQKELFHLQYFLARDFSLDEQLYKDCKDDAKKICNAADFDGETPSLPPGIVVACLFRNSMHDTPKDHKVSAQCAGHVKRVMHVRATNVKLMPEIEKACMHDLGDKCVGQTKDGEEIKCLQQNYEQLNEKCKDAIANFTELESEDMELDKDLITACAPMVLKFCQDVVKEGNTEGVLPCLIENKHNVEMDLKCAASIEHWQILELKDLRFSHKLKKACFDDIEKHCRQSKSKLDAVKCLSAKIQESIQQNKVAEVSEPCQNQIKAELMEEHEDVVHFDPVFYESCKHDLKSFCAEVLDKGQGKAEECLRRQHPTKLKNECRKALFKVEFEEAKDPSLDYQLSHICKPIIKKHCMHEEPMNYLRCLREHKNDVDMPPECREIIFERQKEGSKDFRLDPDIGEFCMRDVEKFCKHVSDKEQRGEVMKCLKKQLKVERLSEDCATFVRMRIEEAALDFRLDPVLEQACHYEIPRFCSEEQLDHGHHGKVVDCLKANYKKITSKECKEEVKRLVGEAIGDIHADPHLAQECNIDMKKYCDHTLEEEGKVVECLLEVFRSKNLKLEKKCKKLLRKRMELWSAVDVNVKLDSINDVISQVHASPNRQYIYTVTLCMLAVIFIGGLCCGRITKRVAKEYKDR